MSRALEVIDISAKIEDRLALQRVSLLVDPGEVVGVVGANGAGKSTLMRAALGLVPLQAGQARLGDWPVAALSEAQRAALAGYLPQERKAAWNLAAVSVAALGAIGEPPARAQATAREMLERVGLLPLAERGVLDMSGGERARVLLARLLATRAPLLAADEPAAGLDPDAQLLVLDILRREADRGAAVLVTLHDLTLAARYCDRLVALRHGRVVASGPPDQVLSSECLGTIFGLDGALVQTPHGTVAALKRRP